MFSSAVFGIIILLGIIGLVLLVLVLGNAYAGFAENREKVML